MGAGAAEIPICERHLNNPRLVHKSSILFCFWLSSMSWKPPLQPKQSMALEHPDQSLQYSLACADRGKPRMNPQLLHRRVQQMLAARKRRTSPDTPKQFVARFRASI